MYQEARNTVKVRMPPLKEGEVPVPLTWRQPGSMENYLTELLSLAILADWRPMAEFLGDLDHVRAAGPITSIRPYTQQRMFAGTNLNDRAQLDLVLAIDGTHDDAAEVWIEVKAGAPLSGDQIPRYLQAIREANDNIPRRLVVLDIWCRDLSAFLHGDGAPVRCWTWTELEFVAAKASSRFWRELAAFLRERSLVTATTTRAATLALSPDWLAGAITGAVVPPIMWCNWQSGRDAQSTRASMLKRLNRNVGLLGAPYVQRWAPGQLTRIEAGAIDRPDTLTLRLALTSAYGIPHEVLRRHALASGLAARGWHLGRDRDDDVIIFASAPFDESADPGDGARWLRERLTELLDADLLPDLDGDGRPRVRDSLVVTPA
jgi:hypothetical protein